ncbi:hypothetical protein [Ethanoligenens harbinense]|uniref:Uncharacterized protein n=1 Tax=Ethanoligenens harbinense (strain DSM 18485 / JCM 12961 / CGMCC 1.5033 / YUAN-3) TaxID=663278 RepID=E6U2T8_ETHHY|nr:hypothetical protein [Ethanoligenens harbinense]ADU27480.1 hypothetical protein Ethha_1962 [Ethanoligenens harbinense YUAN-3]AVQ96537.1 hypothetical protein CXQ68_10050 [Ethanoligenens harbinense YUAN-3]AYF39199.1 hypothetical protein CXP51_09940 [Ethanoligenens harbinense]AYF42022.1 hypothetical protein CN246_10490 [Ethanoligenens harbinense]QCN92777.1 hypothetical protein DRA42_10080 [Ethanoligenens harbinense]
MDTYVECLVKRRTDRVTLALKIGVVLASIALGLGLFFICVATQLLATFGILALLLCIWGGWMILRRFELEYEYILTNFDLDIDVIIAQKKRRRLLSLDLRAIEHFAPFDEAHRRQLGEAEVRKRVDASAHDKDGTWYLIVDSKSGGRTLLLFSPDERIQKAVRAANPRAVL